MEIRRGDVVIVDLDPTEGSEQRGRRPCVVVQNDVGNQYSPTTIVAPFTTQFDSDETYPFEAEVTADRSPLNEDSVADLSQLRVVDVDRRIHSNLGGLSDSIMADIDRAIRESLGL